MVGRVIGLEYGERLITGVLVRKPRQLSSIECSGLRVAPMKEPSQSIWPQSIAHVDPDGHPDIHGLVAGFMLVELAVPRGRSIDLSTNSGRVSDDQTGGRLTAAVPVQ